MSIIRYMEGAPGAYDSLYRGEGAPGAYDSCAGRSSMMSEMRAQAGAEKPFLARAK